jgi:hypothetical protein
MKFMMTFDWAPDTQARAEGITRFQKTGGAPPEGVKLLGRWTRTDLSGGCVLLETDNASKLFEFAYQWGDLMNLETSPVLDDTELAAALQTAAK